MIHKVNKMNTSGKNIFFNNNNYPTLNNGIHY